MARFRLDLEYDGSDFWGWQVQPDRRTVQGTLEAALGRLLGEPVRVVGAGRTDRGCHATGQVAHFDSGRPADLGALRRGLPSLLPPDIRMRGIRLSSPAWHARFAASSRHYVYLLAARPSALARRHAWCVDAHLDRPRMQVAARAILGEHDFRGFAVQSGVETTGRCRVLRARWDRWRAGLRFRIEADRFLTRMVRMLVGAMVEIGAGRLPPGAMAEQLESTEPLAAAAELEPGDHPAVTADNTPARRSGRRPAAAPAAGLYLAGVCYDPADWARDDPDRPAAGAPGSCPPAPEAAPAPAPDASRMQGGCFP